MSKGLFNKYTVTKNEGPIDPDAVYFVLRLDTDPAARSAAAYYASAIALENPQLYSDLWELVNDLIERDKVWEEQKRQRSERLAKYFSPLGGSK